jgi:peptidyl-prolyl cis-trans isomerase C
MSMYKVIAFGIGLAAGSIVASAQPAPLTTGPNGLQVTAAEVIEDVNQRVPPEMRLTVLNNPSNVAQLATTLAVRRALAVEAERQQLDKDPRIDYQIRVARERILADARLQQIEGAKPDAAMLEKLALAEYHANPGKYAIPERIRVRHILIDSRACDAQQRIDELLAMAKAPGADFAKLARENSQDSGSARRGGDLGFFERGKMDPAFEQAAFALEKPGNLSDVVRSQFGLHIILLEQRTPAGREPFEKVREALVEDIATREAKRRRSAAVDGVTSKVTVNQEAVEAFAQQQGK